MVVLAGTLLLPHPARAAGVHPSLSVSPAIGEWVVAPGQSQTRTVRVSNLTNDPLPISSVVRGLDVQEKIATTDRTIFDASTWFHVEDGDFILPSNQNKIITVKVTVPKNAEPGGHYATVFFQQLLPSSGDTFDPTTLVGRVGVLGFVTVKGTITKKVTAPKSPFTRRDNGSNELVATLLNQGNIHVLPTGEFIVKDWHNHVISHLPFDKGLLLPRTQREYMALWHPPKFGKVTITANITYGEAHQKVGVPAVTLWFLPWHWIIASLALGSVVSFATIVRKRWRRAWEALWKK